jgi:hypothetical protein
MHISIEKPHAAVSVAVNLLLVSLISPAQLHAQYEQSVMPTFEETHAQIKELILDKQILQNHWHKMDFPQYNHFDDAVWSLIMYSGDECKITYRRKFEVSHKSQESVKPIYGDKPAKIIGYKTAKFDMAQVETIEIHDYGDSRGSIPSVGIRFIGPTAEWQTIGDKPRKADLSKDPVMKEDNAISVSAKDSERVLEAFQHLKALCQTDIAD